MSSGEFEKATLSDREITALWNTLLDPEGESDFTQPRTITLADLNQIMQSLGRTPTEAELHHLMQEVDRNASGAIEFEEFRALMVSRHGDRASRLTLAFSVLDEDGNGQISASELYQVMCPFGLTDTELDAMIQEVDRDGDRAINFEEFCQLGGHESASGKGYKDTLDFSNRAPTPDRDKPLTIAKTEQSTFKPPSSPIAQQGTSRLQMRMGLFRLIQGAAYRCFQESYCVNHETHLRVKNLPYRITDFVPFVKDTIALYKALGVIESACYPVLDALVTSIVEEYARLEARIQNWESVEKTPEMLATEQAMLAARKKSATVQEKFAAGVEFAITLKKQRLTLADVTEGVLAIHELDRLRKLEQNDRAPDLPDDDSKAYLSQFGSDLAKEFPTCTVPQKLVLKQAWQLTRSYLNGVQKRRERVECGRESGSLSHYVAFVDLYLNQRTVQTAQMRLSYPYYLGPGVWRFLHTTAEIVCTQPVEQQSLLVAQIKAFFQRFAALYPCPYCRHHLNLYVVQNREVELYPVEYLMLGREFPLTDLVVSIEDKLSTLVDGVSLRLFFWKLHNTVSASISRSEAWYRRDEKAFYTSRYYPSLEAELAQAKALDQNYLSRDRVSRLYTVFRPASQLAGLRLTLTKQLEQRDYVGSTVSAVVQKHIQELDQAMLNAQFLQETYRFDPDLADHLPQVTRADEAFARSGLFAETVLSMADRLDGYEATDPLQAKMTA